VVAGKLPASKKLGGRVLWDRIQIDRALDRLFDSDGDKEVVDPYSEIG
jgi:hypothetical protein